MCIRDRHIDSFSSFCEQKRKSGDYYFLCTRCANLVGRNNVIVRPYEKNQFRGGSIFHDFLECIGLTLTNEYKLPSSQVNASLSLDTLFFKRIYNNLPSTLEQKRAVAKMLESYCSEVADGRDTRNRLLSPKQQIDVIRNYDKINRRVAIDFLDRSDGILFYEKLPDGDGIWQNPHDVTFKEKVQILDYLVRNSNWHERRTCVAVPVFSGLFSASKQIRKSALKLLFPLVLTMPYSIIAATTTRNKQNNRHQH